MKANELMIGDWVYDTILKGNTKVETLSSSGIKGDFHENVCDENTFEPIPLTPEILEKNGFSRNGLDIALFDRKGGDDFVGASNLQCVHELQHALRLCGIEKEIEL